MNNKSIIQRIIRNKRKILSGQIFLMIIKRMISLPKKLISKIRFDITRYLGKYALSDFRTATSQSNDLNILIDCLESKKFNKHRHKGTISFLVNLFKYINELLGNLPTFISIAPDKPVYIIQLCVWGDPYVDKMIKYLIPSLLAPNNIPAIANTYTIFLWVHCDQRSYDQLNSSVVVASLGKYISVKYDIIPPNVYNKFERLNKSVLLRVVQKILGYRVEFKYYLLGSLQNIAMLTAQKNRALFSFFMPDFLFSDKSLSNMSELMRDGYKAILGGAFRSAAHELDMHLINLRHNDVLLVTGEDLSRIVVKTMHKAATVRIVSNQNTNLNLCPQFIFAYPNEVVVRALHSHPLLVNFGKVETAIYFDYLPIDNELLLKIIDSSHTFASQLYVIERPEDISFMEISDDDVEVIIKRTYNKSISEHVKDYISLGGWEKVNFYLLSKRCRYMAEPPSGIFKSDISDTALIDPLLTNII